MKHVGGILTAVALSLSLSGTSIEARGLKQTRRDLTEENVIHNPQETPFFQLLPQTNEQVEQLNAAKKWMNLVGLATFIGMDGQKMSVNRYDALRGVVENIKHWVDKSNTASRVMHHKTFSYNAGVKTPLQYGKGGRAGSDVDGKLSRAVRVNSNEEGYKGPSIATLYAERSPMMLDAKKVDDVESFATYFAQTLVDNPALNTIVANVNARPVLLLTVQKNLLLNEVPAETIQKLQSWFTVTTLAEQDVNKFFAEAANRIIDLSGSYAGDLKEVAVPLEQGIWNDFSGLFQNFDWKRFVRVTVKDGSKKILGQALPIMVALALFAQWQKAFKKKEKKNLNLDKKKIEEKYKDSMAEDKPFEHAQNRLRDAKEALNTVASSDTPRAAAVTKKQKIKAATDFAEAQAVLNQLKHQLGAAEDLLDGRVTHDSRFSFLRNSKLSSIAHASDNRRKMIMAASVATLLASNVLPVAQERGSIDKMVSWKALKAIIGRLIGNLYGAKQHDEDTNYHRAGRTAANWVAWIMLVQSLLPKAPAARA